MNNYKFSYPVRKTVSDVSMKNAIKQYIKPYMKINENCDITMEHEGNKYNFTVKTDPVQKKMNIKLNNRSQITSKDKLDELLDTDFNGVDDYVFQSNKFDQPMNKKIFKDLIEDHILTE